MEVGKGKGLDDLFLFLYKSGYYLRNIIEILRLRSRSFEGDDFIKDFGSSISGLKREVRFFFKGKFIN